MHGSTTAPRHEFARRWEWIGYGLRRMVGALAAGSGHPERGRLHREVMRLDAVNGGGHTPSNYGWHVDALLNVGVHYANDPVVAPEVVADEDSGLPARVPDASVYRVPRRKSSQPRILLRPNPMG